MHFHRFAFRNLTIRNTVFRNCSFDGASFVDTVCHGVRFVGCSLESGHHRNWTLQPTSASSDRRRCAFWNSQISGEFQGCDLRDTHIDYSVLAHALFHGCQAKSVDFGVSKLHHCRFVGCNLDLVKVRGKVTGCEFDSTSMFRADFQGAGFSSTAFTSCDTERMRVNRFDLERLGADYGGLTPWNRITMDIEDDFLKMSVRYAGVMQWVFWASVAVFAFPYAWFFIESYIASRAFPKGAEVKSRTILEALALFVWTGGGMDARRPDVFGLVLFAVSLSYYLIRFTLVRATSRLRQECETKGWRPYFEFRLTRQNIRETFAFFRVGRDFTRRRWLFWWRVVPRFAIRFLRARRITPIGLLYKIDRWLFWVIALVALVSTGRFLLTHVPAP